MEWYTKSIQDAIKDLSSDKDRGLGSEEAEKRLEKFGSNELEEGGKASLLSKILAQFKDFLVIILIVASIISAFVGETSDAIVIIAIVIVNAVLGIVQEGKAEKALESLQKMSSPNAKVIRDGELTTIPATTIVPGDIVVLEAGDIVPADLRLIESSNLKIEEASLTGESVPVEKDFSKVLMEDAPLGDRQNMAYMGTVITYGRGKGLVIGTGTSTEMGKIAQMLNTFKAESTPLQKKLDQLGKYLGIACLIVCGLVFAIGLLQGRDILDMFMTSISLAVAAIPEGLPAIVTIVLALGMNRMVKRNAIVKKLLAVETLGATTVICSDKTGTLTQNEMTVVKIYAGGEVLDVSGRGYGPEGSFTLNDKEIDIDSKGEAKTLLSIGGLCNDASLNNDKENGTWNIVGDPTEGALITLAGKGNMTKQGLNGKYPRINEIPFDSDRKMMTTFHDNFMQDRVVSFTKGAPDIIINRCTKVLLNGRELPMTDEMREKVLHTNASFSKSALRVLAFAMRTYDTIPDVITSEEIEKDLTLVGLVGMIDPPRSEAAEAIEVCKQAGIKTIMITGDYKDTAFAIAKELGIAEREDQVMAGDELNKISDDELAERVEDIRVFARVSPEHKVRIVEALKKNGEIVAMTGDGVNDAPALKRADIGVSMGITGTDVAKNTAEVILMDDNFATIVSAVEEGRIIYSNIRKFVFFLLSCNVGEILIVFLSILFNWPVPLLPIQLLWLNLITDSFPALALGMERSEPDIMKVRPRDADEPILDKNMGIGIAVQSIALTVAVLLAYNWAFRAYDGNLVIARTIAFSTLITAELIRAYSSRSERFTLFEIGFFSNKTMVYATLLSFMLLILVLYVPVLQPIFKSYPLSIGDWGAVIRYCIIPVIAGEISKLIRKKR